MSKTVSVSDDNYEWLVSESGKLTAKQRKKVSIDEVIKILIEKCSKKKKIRRL